MSNAEKAEKFAVEHATQLQLETTLWARLEKIAEDAQTDETLSVDNAIFSVKDAKEVLDLLTKVVSSRQKLEKKIKALEGF